jgi:Sec1 family
MVPLLRHPQLSYLPHVERHLTSRVTDKMRILMLYILFKDGITEEDLQLLLRHSGLESRAHELPLRNLDLLGHFRVTKSFAEHKAAGKNRRRPKAPNPDDESYELSRYVPPIKTVLEDLINGTLDPQTWAYTIDQPAEVQPTGQLGSLRTYFTSRISLLTCKATPHLGVKGKSSNNRSPTTNHCVYCRGSDIRRIPSLL